MKLVACLHCHAQYDVTHVETKSFACRCGEELEARPPEGVERDVQRCGACGALLAAGAEQCEYCRSAVVRALDGPSLICPECYARNLDGCRFCTACGVSFAPSAIPTQEVELPCPCCGALMPVREVGGIALNECPGCHGLWVPEGHFAALVQRAIDAHAQRGDAQPAAQPRVRGANPGATRVSYRRCPVCEAMMNRHNFQRRSGVIIDVCKPHGTWLDADELEQICGFIQSGGLASAQLREAERAREEERAARTERVFAEAKARFETTPSSAGHGRAEARVIGSVVDFLSSLLS
jgi:Zn-finger nucleic acid-binding protein